MRWLLLGWWFGCLGGCGWHWQAQFTKIPNGMIPCRYTIIVSRYIVPRPPCSPVSTMAVRGLLLLPLASLQRYPIRLDHAARRRWPVCICIRLCAIAAATTSDRPARCSSLLPSASAVSILFSPLDQNLILSMAPFMAGHRLWRIHRFEHLTYVVLAPALPPGTAWYSVFLSLY